VAPFGSAVVLSTADFDPAAYVPCDSVLPTLAVENCSSSGKSHPLSTTSVHVFQYEDEDKLEVTHCPRRPRSQSPRRHPSAFGR